MRLYQHIFCPHCEHGSKPRLSISWPSAFRKTMFSDCDGNATLSRDRGTGVQGGAQKVGWSRKDLTKESLRDIKLRQGVKNIWIFGRLWSCWENTSKSLRAAEKNKEKIEVICTGFSADFFGSKSVEMFYFARKTKTQMLTTWQESTNVFLIH